MTRRFGPYLDLPKAHVLPFVPSTARRVLDVGCLAGGFGTALKAARPDIEVVGIEVREECIPLARERLDRVIQGSFPEAMAPEQFDCVDFIDVLEHMEDPWAALRSTSGFLAPGGVVVASIPNVRHYSVVWPLIRHGTWDYADDGILDRTHLRFFTKASTRELFESTGYEVAVLEPANLTRPGGPASTLLHRLGRFGEDFLTVQFGVVARPGRSAPAPGSGPRA